MAKKNKTPGKRAKGPPNAVANKTKNNKHLKKKHIAESKKPEIDTEEFWKVVSRAIETDYRPETEILGSSGINHRVEAIMVDDKRNRLVLFAAASSPQNAALMRVDVEATMPGTRVIVARPIAFDLVEMAKQTFGMFGTKIIDINEFAEKVNSDDSKDAIQSGFNGIIDPFANAWKNAQLPLVEQIMGFVQQASQLNWERMFEDPKRPILDIGNLLPRDSLETDISLGVCPFPLYQLTEKDWGLYDQKTDNDQIIDHLKDLGVFQYFFPPPDQALLGVNEFKPDISSQGVLDSVKMAPDLGHPFGDIELVDNDLNLFEVLLALKEEGFVVEGEFGLTITDKGKEVRQQLKLGPREGLVIRLIKAFKPNINFNL